MGSTEILSNKLWDEEFSTRQSTAIWPKYQPVDLTLTTPGTAENIISVARLIPTINLVTNPSFETGDPPTGYTAVGSTLAQSNTVAKYGTYSISVTPDNAATGEGFYYSLGTIAQRTPVAVSVWLQKNAVAGVEKARIRLYDNTNGAYLASGNEITLSASWQRSSVVIRELAETVDLRIYIEDTVQAATVYYADGLQAELQPFVSDYCDGDQGLFYAWDGTANASQSSRNNGIAKIRGFNLHFTRDCYVAFDKDASDTTSRRFVKAGTDWFMDSHPIWVTRISLLNYLAGEQVRCYGEIWGA